MPSSNKTTNLSLNQWSGADKPKRADFNADNSALDSKVGGHMKNDTIHVTKSDKDAWNKMWHTDFYLGNDLNTRTISGLPFEPSALFVAAAEFPFTQWNSTSGRNTAFAAFATKVDSTQGLKLAGTSFTVRETTVPLTGNEYAGLNRSGTTYIYVAFR